MKELFQFVLENYLKANKVISKNDAVFQTLTKYILTSLIRRSLSKVDRLDKTLQRIDKFNLDRDWNQFHSPENLSKSISIEAAELLECFQWDENNYDLEAVKEELADVMNYCLQMALVLKLDPIEIINKKIDKNEKKYPVEKAKGVSTKYNKL